jgi:hypothetical protein
MLDLIESRRDAIKLADVSPGNMEVAFASNNGHRR